MKIKIELPSFEQPLQPEGLYCQASSVGIQSVSLGPARVWGGMPGRVPVLLPGQLGRAVSPAPAATDVSLPFIVLFYSFWIHLSFCKNFLLECSGVERLDFLRPYYVLPISDGLVWVSDNTILQYCFGGNATILFVPSTTSEISIDWGVPVSIGLYPHPLPLCLLLLKGPLSFLVSSAL